MCGIAGALAFSRDEARAAVDAMCKQMVARGPDDEGIAILGRHDGAVAALGSRRLAIIDPSPAGHQPMADPERGTTIVYNGMLYNFADLRTQLGAAGERFRSHCDTEVILRAYGRYGPGCVERLRGMFAFAIWDEGEQTLFLARDRLGIKPLYYARDGERFLFASQVKALLASGLVEAELSVAGVASYLAFGAVSDPLTAIEGVVALPAAHTAVVRNGELALTRYWEPPRDSDAELTRDEAVRELRTLLDDTVRRHLVSDVPLGVFLSGGVDSSVLAALAARETPHVRTVSVVFDDPDLSEEPYIDLVASRIASDHVKVRVEPEELLQSLDGAFEAMDQPSFDGINTYVVSRAAADTGLKVALSGLGGDELFDGYGHVSRVRLLERARRLPRPLLALSARAAGVAPTRSATEKARAWLRSSPEPGSSYELLRRLFLPGEVRVLCPRAVANGHGPRPAPVDLRRDVHTEVARLDLTNYTRNVLLRDTDAMSMASSLEVRVPFLDDALVEWVLRVPGSVKAGRGKALLADAVRDVLPPETLARRKQGFVLPLARWMQGELREEVDERLLRPTGPLSELVDGHRSGAIWDEFLRDGQRWHRPWSLYALARWVESMPAHARV